MDKTFIRFFTIADYEEEEIWLREMHKKGWRLIDMTPPCFFRFEACQPQDVIYRLDYKDDGQTEEYLRMAADFGWEYCDQYFGWLYFRKPADEARAEGEDQLFSDHASRAEMAGRIVRTRLLPLLLIFVCCLLPNLINAIEGKMSAAGGILGAILGILTALYVYLIVHCGLKLKAIRDRYRD